jgi:hypothetical protein
VRGNLSREEVIGSWRSNTTNWANSPDLPISATSIGAWQSVTPLWRKKPQSGQESGAGWARSRPSRPRSIVALRTSDNLNGIFNFSLLGQRARRGRLGKLISSARESIMWITVFFAAMVSLGAFGLLIACGEK